MKSLTKFSRRSFIKAVGAGPGLLPLISTDFARGGCLTKPPRRLVAVVWTNGVLERAGGSGTTFSLPATMQSLSPLRTEIIPINGVHLQNLRDTPNPQKADNAGHGATPSLLTGKQYYQLKPFVEIGGGPSIDSWVAAGLQQQGVNTPRLTINLGANVHEYIATWRDSNRGVKPDGDPFHAFKDIFTGANPTSDPNAAKLAMARGSMLDTLKNELSAFKQTVGHDNGMIIDGHLASLRELESNLQAKDRAAAAGGKPGGCQPPALGAAFSTDASNFDKVIKADMDIVVSAFAADVTRAATIQMGDEGNGGVIPGWLGYGKTGDNSSGVGDANGMHSMAHRGGADKLKLDTWYHQQFAYLIGKLQAEKEADGSSMLDNTVVLVVNHMQNGGSHSTDNIQFLLAGRCGGYFKTGQAVAVSNIMHTAVLKECIKAMQVDPTGFFQPQYDADLPPLRA